MNYMTSQQPSWREWLTTDAPTSRRHARLANLYQGWLTLRANSMAMFGLGILLALLLVALLAPVLSPHDPFEQSLSNRLQPLGTEGHILGTDSLGRDILSRLIYGSRITLYIVALVALIAPVAGLLVGTVAGYVGGWTDTILMRITDIFLAFPRLVLALAFVAALGAGIENAVLAISLTAWPPYARIARAETLTIRSADYISAIRLQGAGALRIITKHIWPLCISSLIVRVTLDMAGIILAAAGLGFLGLGAQPPSPEWGAMISEGRRFILDHWWVATVPGLAIFTVSLAFNLLGDGLRDVLDPKDGGQ
jgi:peptide/nickel transport system permease protein